MKGVAVEGLPESKGGRVSPVVLAIEGREPLAFRHGLTGPDLLKELMAGSDTGGDLVTIRVDYLAAMIALGCPSGFAESLWRGDRVTVAEYTVDLIPALCIWIRCGDRVIRVNDIQRWIPPDAAEAAAIFTPDRLPPKPLPRWTWGAGDYDQAVASAVEQAEWAGDLAREVNDALSRAGLPRHWRDGTGRVAGATLDRITGKNAAIVTRPPMVLDRAINTAYVGGRITVHQTGRFDHITQVDMNSAYPYAMTFLPSLEGAKWVRRRWYDPSEPFGLWRVSWDVPAGAISGPLPVRTANNAICYPLAGSGWYWSTEVAAALACYGSCIEPGDGFAIRPATDERPFADLLTYYRERKALKQKGDRAAAHVAKLGLTSCYGRLAQAIQHNGKPGRWGSLALAGMTTAMVRAHMMMALWEHEGTAIAIATDSLTVSGGVDLIGSDALGGWSVETGGDALMLPSGVFRVATGAAAMDRVAGVERARALAIDWESIYSGWDVLGFGLSYRVAVPVFVGLGAAGSVNQWGKFGRWYMGNHEIVGKPNNAKPVRVSPRVWKLMPMEGKPMKANAYRPRTGALGRLHDQTNTTIPETAREHDQPFT